MATGRTHDCYENYILKDNAKLFRCDGCKMNGFGQRYVCDLCDNELHKGCRFPKGSISHEYFGCSTFILTEFPSIKLDKYHNKVYASQCAACEKDVHGLSYHCKDKNLDIHPSCYKLERKLLIDDTIFDLKGRLQSSKCKWCDSVDISNGWSYASSCNKYHFHVYCVTEMMHEAQMKHGELGSEKIALGSSSKSKNNNNNIIGLQNNFGTNIKLFTEIVLKQFVENGKLAMKKVYRAAKSLGIQIKITFYDRIINFMREKVHKIAHKVLVEELVALCESQLNNSTHFHTPKAGMTSY